MTLLDFRVEEICTIFSEQSFITTIYKISTLTTKNNHFKSLKNLHQKKIWTLSPWPTFFLFYEIFAWDICFVRIEFYPHQNSHIFTILHVDRVMQSAGTSLDVFWYPHPYTKNVSPFYLGRGGCRRMRIWASGYHSYIQMRPTPSFRSGFMSNKTMQFHCFYSFWNKK